MAGRPKRGESTRSGGGGKESQKRGRQEDRHILTFPLRFHRFREFLHKVPLLFDSPLTAQGPALRLGADTFGVNRLCERTNAASM